MDDLRFGRSLRAVRVRRRLRQADLAGLAGVSGSTISRLERGHLGHLSIDTIRRVSAALDVRTQLLARWRGGELGRLVAARHTNLAASVVSRLEMAGWRVRAEVTFSIYGERGAIDVLAWHPGALPNGRAAIRTPAGPSRVSGHPSQSDPSGLQGVSSPLALLRDSPGDPTAGRRRSTGPEAPCLLVVEFKTEIVDVGELLATLHRKVRLAPRIARDLGWEAGAVSACLIVAEGRTNRRHVQSNASLLRAALPDDGRRFGRWVTAPAGTVSAVVFWPDLHPGVLGQRRAPVQRIRRCMPPAPGG